MIAVRDPREMTRDERLREVSELLARGYLRLLISRSAHEKALDTAPELEPPCPRLVNRMRAPGKEGCGEKRHPSDRGAS